MTELNPNWEFVADKVMGGVSEGTLSQEVIQGEKAAVLRGGVSLDNNGGFIQMAFDLLPDRSGLDVSGWDGIELTVLGNNQSYDIRLRTEQLTRPWQSFRTEFKALSEWQTLRIPFNAFVAHKVDFSFDASQLKRIGILAIGREFEVEIAVSAIRFYRE